VCGVVLLPAPCVRLRHDRGGHRVDSLIYIVLC
jgi:hypothetical protein